MNGTASDERTAGQKNRWAKGRMDKEQMDELRMSRIMMIGVSLLASSVCSVSSRINERIGLSLEPMKTGCGPQRNIVFDRLV